MGNDARQLAILAAIGIDVYRLRARDAAIPVRPAAATAAPEPADGADIRLVIAAEAGLRREPRAARRIAQRARAIGAADAQTRSIDVADGAAVALPDAPAYLLIGAAARACGSQMPIARQQAAAIAVIDELAIATGAARRVAWQTLKPLARRVRAGAG